MKTRAITRTREVPHTIDGITRLVTEPYTVHIPVPPRDWDRLVLAAVTAVAALAVAASVVWSTASIGDLLARAVPAAPAYAAAVVFDAAWITCMAVEWLARYDTARATLPRRAGHAALLVAMAAVAVHGRLVDQLAVGIVGAAVSGLAKGIWTVVLRHHAKPLDARTQQWVDQQRAELGGKLAMITVRRQAQRAEGLVAAEAAALGATAETDPETDPENPESGPENPEDARRQLHAVPMTVVDAVRTAVDCGIHDEAAVLRYAREVADPNAKEATVARYVREFRKGAS